LKAPTTGHQFVATRKDLSSTSNNHLLEKLLENKTQNKE
jgi:hypothetical protein